FAETHVTGPLTAEDLEGDGDGVRAAPRRAEVQDYLPSPPEQARRIERYREHRAVLREALAPIAAEPLPPELNLARMIEARRHPRLEWTRWAAAAAVLLLIGGAAGWSMRGMTEHGPRGILALGGEATDRQQVYASDRVRAVEMEKNESGGADPVGVRTPWPDGLGAGPLRFGLSVHGRTAGRDPTWPRGAVHVRRPARHAAGALLAGN